MAEIDSLIFDPDELAYDDDEGLYPGETISQRNERLAEEWERNKGE